MVKKIRRKVKKVAMKASLVSMELEDLNEEDKENKEKLNVEDEKIANIITDPSNMFAKRAKYNKKDNNIQIKSNNNTFVAQEVYDSRPDNIEYPMYQDFIGFYINPNSTVEVKPK